MNPIEAYLSTSFEQAKQFLILPWLNSLQFTTLPSAILLPSAELIAWVKQIALEESITLLNVKFFTPGTFRGYLTKQRLHEKLPLLREDLHLLMRMTALEELKDNNNSFIALEAVKKPERVVQLFDIFTGSNQDLNDIDNKDVVKLLTRFSHKLQEFQLDTIQLIDQKLAKQSTQTIYFEKILIYAFSHTHWDSNTLLKLALNTSNHPTICFHTAHSSSESEQAYFGTWEESCGALDTLPEIEAGKFTYISDAFDCPIYQDATTENNDLHTIIYKDIWQEADAIAEIVKSRLKEGSHRIGIVVPSSASLLGREVGKRLEELNIPHYNHLGYMLGPNPKTQAFASYIQWQETRTLSDLVPFLERLLEQKSLSYQNYKAITRIMDDAFRDTMVEDTDLLFAYTKKENVTEAFSIEWNLFPKSAPLKNYLTIAENLSSKINYTSDPSTIQSRAKVLQAILDKELSRELFLSWYRTIFKDMGRIRNPIGEHPFSPVQIITQDQAVLQIWDDLIICSLNSQSWPRDSKSNPLLPDKNIQSINKKTLTSGSQGSGHLCTKDEKSLLQTSTDQNLIDETIFRQLIALPKEKLILTAHLNDPITQGKILNPSKFLERVYLITEDNLLSNQELNDIIERSESWLNQKLHHEIKPLNNEINQTLLAYTRRRDINTPFDEYSFGGAPEIRLSAKNWELALKTPEDIWSKQILKLEPKKNYKYKDSKALTIGTWVHDWLTIQDKNPFPVKVPTEDHWISHISNLSQQIHSKVNKAFSSVNRKLPSWWNGHFQEALKISIDLGKKVSENLNQYFILTEYNLPKESHISTTNGYKIPITGRIDLIAINNQRQPEDAQESLWIIDYKTAKRPSMTPHQVTQGNGLQLILYGMVFKDRGTNDIQFSIMNPDMALKPQLHLDKITGSEGIFLAMERIHKTGILGQRNTSNNPYGYAPPLPYSHLTIAEDLISAKWNLSYPEFQI